MFRNQFIREVETEKLEISDHLPFFKNLILAFVYLWYLKNFFNKIWKVSKWNYTKKWFSFWHIRFFRVFFPKQVFNKSTRQENRANLFVNRRLQQKATRVCNGIAIEFHKSTSLNSETRDNFPFSLVLLFVVARAELINFLSVLKKRRNVRGIVSSMKKNPAK